MDVGADPGNPDVTDVATSGDGGDAGGSSDAVDDAPQNIQQDADSESDLAGSDAGPDVGQTAPEGTSPKPRHHGEDPMDSGLEEHPVVAVA